MLVVRQKNLNKKIFFSDCILKMPRFTRKRKRTFRRGTKKFRKGRKVARVGTVKKMINRMIEHKWKYGSVAGTIDFVLSAPVLLNGFVKGSNRDQRTGNKCKFTSIQWSMLWVAGNMQASRIRMMVFRDTQSTAGTPTAGNQVANLFAQGSPITTSTILSPLNPDVWPARFRMLSDRTFHCDVEGGATDINAERQTRGTIRLGFTTQYNDGNTGTISDINKNGLYVLIISDETPPQSLPTVQWSFVLRYEDA
jgi:hypothetical protein